MTPVKTRLTLDEFMALPEDDLFHELDEGELITMPPAKPEHGMAEIDIAALLHAFVRSRGLGRVFPSDTGFQLSVDPSIVRAPDVSFVRQERVQTRKKGEYIHGAPDLAVEVVSPSDTARGLQRKVAQYFRYGGRCVWVVYPEAKEVHVFTAPNQVQICRGDDPVTAGDVLPGFSIAARDLFEQEDEA